ncbi:MAG: hypothetical protein M0Z44_09130 [Gammaproteobacteria bacterium]|nr:hypothetical protein [Gammaproteobacteria bacterium]
MKIAFLFLLLANAALGVWGYLHVSAGVIAPAPYHPGRLVRWQPPAAAVRPPAPAAAPATHPPAPAAKKPAQPKPAAAPVHCWRFGPFATRARAVAFLGHQPGAVHVQAGHVTAYRVFLPVSMTWPDAVQLRADGVQGAYVTRGPRGGRVLSLGVFNNRAATRRYRGDLLRHGLRARQAALVSPAQYYADLLTRSSLNGALVKRPHVTCVAPPSLH